MKFLSCLSLILFYVICVFKVKYYSIYETMKILQMEKVLQMLFGLNVSFGIFKVVFFSFNFAENNKTHIRV